MEEQQNQNQNQNQNETQQVQPQYMWYKYIDKNGYERWDMGDDYKDYFLGLTDMISDLKKTINKKWNAKQLSEYQRFLADVEKYILDYIWTAVVADLNVFKDTMNSYGIEQNPIGRQLYEIQVDYKSKVAQGYDFSLDKKKKKALNKEANSTKVVEQKPKQTPKVKEQVVIRVNDPEININTLMNTNWSEDKYTNIQKFKKENANMVFIGHVDSGKSTLTGNIMKELNQVDEQQWARNKQQAKQNHMEAWELAGIADVDPNERKRGKTVEYAKLMFTLESRRFTVFDAPGHKNYVPNMIMGACQADIAVLIISAKEGEYESGFEKEGQTKEHAMLAKALGVSGFIVTVTKMNTVDWSEKRFNLIKSQVTPFLENNCGFKGVQFIPIDSITNVNVHRKVQDKWYKGPCLMEVLNHFPLPERKPMSPLRIPLIDKFRQVGNLFLYGKLESGTIIENQTVTILPSRKQLMIKEIFNAKDQRLPFAMAGENVKMKVKGIEEGQIKRGDIICNNLNYCQQTSEFKCTINILELPQNKKIVAAGYECVLHMHAIAEQVEILKVQSKYEPTLNKNVPATFLKMGEQGTVIIKCQNTLCLQKHEFMPSLGRFTLRDQGKTIGFGLVNKIKPARKLLEEQKEQLGLNKEEKQIAKDLNNLKVSN